MFIQNERLRYKTVVVSSYHISFDQDGIAEVTEGLYENMIQLEGFKAVLDLGHQDKDSLSCLSGHSEILNVTTEVIPLDTPPATQEYKVEVSRTPVFRE